jgi:hypothetical protein
LINLGFSNADWCQLKLQIAYLFGWQTRLEIQFQANIKEQLKQGAIKRAERDLGLVKEWFNLEEEAC